MTYTKDVIKSEAIPQEYLDNAKKCFMCGSEVNDGGTWAGTSMEHLVTICNRKKCVEEQIKWVIDAFSSDESMDVRHFKTKNDFMNMVEDVYDKKASHPNHNK